VTTQERRAQSLPFIGAERRRDAATDLQTEVEEVAA
jgi:hypothetical protein